MIGSLVGQGSINWGQGSFHPVSDLYFPLKSLTKVSKLLFLQGEKSVLPFITCWRS